MKKSAVLSGILFLCVLVHYNFFACTGVTIKAKDGAVVFGRTLEWGGPDINSNAIIVPRGFKYVGATPFDQKGLAWKVKYAFVGMNVVSEPLLVADGLNEKGLAVGAFYFQDYAKYEPYEKQFIKKTLSPIDFPTWLSSNFANINQVKDGLNFSRVVPVVFKAWGFVLPLHFIVTDSTGASIVIEYINGKIIVYDNPVGSIANSPTFDWHLTNIRNYIDLSPWDSASEKLGKKIFSPFNGSGMLGLPGDFTSPSRFIRGTLFSRYAFPGKNGPETVLKVFHVLNQFDIPEGVFLTKDKNIKTINITEWTSASDTKNRCYYFHTIKNRQIRMIDLKKVDVNAKNVVTIPVYSVVGKIEDVTPKAKQ